MTRKISHYVAKYDMPGYSKGDKVDTSQHNCIYTDVFSPVYEPEVSSICEELKRFCGINTDMVPDGILAFRHPDCADEFKTGTDPKYYKEWYWKCKSFPGTYISKIKVDGVEWSVGEETYQGIIHEFYYKNNCYWLARVGRSDFSHHIDALRKLPTRKPIVTLQGKDMYEGDKFWHVQDYGKWDIIPLIIQKNPNKNNTYRPYRACFHSRELAEQYIRDNKPVYPEGLIDEAIKLGLMCDFTKDPYINDDDRIAILTNKLKAFKPKP